MSSNTRQSTSRETAASFGVLLVLVAVAGWLVLAQRQFSPAVTIAANAAAAAERSATATPPQAALRSSDASTRTDAVPGTPADLLPVWPAGLRPMTPLEAFTPATLSDKIDGKAELYLAAGFVAMRCQRIQAVAGGWFEAFIYEMRTPQDAFAVYSTQKRQTTRDAEIGDYGYTAGNQLCAVHGPYYLELVGADDAATTLAAATTTAREWIARTPVAQHANVARDQSFFPQEHLAGAIMLMSADVFGFDQLNNTYVARYRDPSGASYALFLSRRATPAEAARLAAATRGFFIQDCGGTELPPPPSPAGAVLVDIGGAIDGVFAAGAILAGIHEAPDRASAERQLQQLAAALSAPASAP